MSPNLLNVWPRRRCEGTCRGMIVDLTAFLSPGLAGAPPPGLGRRTRRRGPQQDSAGELLYVKAFLPPGLACAPGLGVVARGFALELLKSEAVLAA